MDNLIEIGMFAGKAFIIFVAVAAILITLAALIAKAKDSPEQIDIKSLNEKFKALSDKIRESVLTKDQLKEHLKAQKKHAKAQEKLVQPHIYVLDFDGDIKASQVETLREEITALLQVCNPEKDEVLLRLESPGGMVHGYGLAAAQLLRLRNSNINLTISVDKVAASGGYMMACIGHKILASPFAILGSIGVLAQLPNIHRLLKKHDIDYQEITAGEYKRTLTIMGEITEKGKQKFAEQIEDTHVLFKQFVEKNRPQLDIPKVATGEYWYGERALDLGLVDDLMTSDEYLLKRFESHKIFSVKIRPKKTFQQKMQESLKKTLTRALPESLLEIQKRYSVLS